MFNLVDHKYEKQTLSIKQPIAQVQKEAADNQRTVCNGNELSVLQNVT